MEKKKKVSLPLLIFGAMVLGTLVGIVASGNEAWVAIISTYVKPTVPTVAGWLMEP